MAVYTVQFTPSRDAFAPDLARSLAVLGNSHAALNQHPQACEALSEALRLLVPYAERYPGSFGKMLGWILGLYLKSAQAASIAPDMELCRRASRVPGVDIDSDAGGQS